MQLSDKAQVDFLEDYHLRQCASYGVELADIVIGTCLEEMSKPAAVVAARQTEGRRDNGQYAPVKVQFKNTRSPSPNAIMEKARWQMV